MTHRTELFEFLCTLIDVQIKKYVSLATFGIGPDARLNAKLVFSEVSELLEFAQQVLDEINSETDDNTNFVKIFDQVKFYVEQEYIRAYAGWLLAENNIHSTVKERVIEQLDKLRQIGNLINYDASIRSKPITEVQRQCEHDSCAIGFRILDLAKKIRDNPEMELDPKIPPHARKVLIENATERYVTFEQVINLLHKQYGDFLQHSELEKSSSTLKGPEAKVHEVKHKDTWQKLLDNYMKINPDSSLFSPDHQWYKVGVNPLEKPAQATSSSNLIFFGGAAAGILLIYSLLHYFSVFSDVLNSEFNI